MKPWHWAWAVSVGLHLLMAGVTLWGVPSKPSRPSSEGVSLRPAIAVSLHTAPPALVRSEKKQHPHRRPAHAQTSTVPSTASEGEAPVLAPEAPATLAASGTPVEQASAPGEDLSLLHEQLRASAEKCYPLRARRFALSGLAEVSFCLSSTEALDQVTLSKSSGHALLDKAAVECVVPGALPLSAPLGCYRVPVRFVVN